MCVGGVERPFVERWISGTPTHRASYLPNQGDACLADGESPMTVLRT